MTLRSVYTTVTIVQTSEEIVGTLIAEDFRDKNTLVKQTPDKKAAGTSLLLERFFKAWTEKPIAPEGTPAGYSLAASFFD